MTAWAWWETAHSVLQVGNWHPEKSSTIHPVLGLKHRGPHSQLLPYFGLLSAWHNRGIKYCFLLSPSLLQGAGQLPPHLTVWGVVRRSRDHNVRITEALCAQRSPSVKRGQAAVSTGRTSGEPHLNYVWKGLESSSVCKYSRHAFCSRTVPEHVWGQERCSWLSPPTAPCPPRAHRGPRQRTLD